MSFRMERFYEEMDLGAISHVTSCKDHRGATMLTVHFKDGSEPVICSLDNAAYLTMVELCKKVEKE